MKLAAQQSEQNMKTNVPVKNHPVEAANLCRIREVFVKSSHACKRHIYRHFCILWEVVREVLQLCRAFRMKRWPSRAKKYEDECANQEAAS
jgi:hypothetical protein